MSYEEKAYMDRSDHKMNKSHVMMILDQAIYHFNLRNSKSPKCELGKFVINNFLIDFLLASSKRNLLSSFVPKIWTND